MTAGGEIKGNGCDFRAILVEKVDGDQVAHSGSGLIHEAAGLSKEYILGVLTDLGNFCLGYLGIKEQMVDDGADQHLVGGRGRKTAAGKNRGLAIGVKAFDCANRAATPRIRAGVELISPSLGVSSFTLISHRG